MRQFRPVFLRGKNINEYSKNTNKDYSRISPRVWIFLNKRWNSGILTIKRAHEASPSWLLIIQQSSLCVCSSLRERSKRGKSENHDLIICSDFILILASRKLSLLLTKIKLSLLVPDIDRDSLCSPCLLFNT